MAGTKNVVKGGVGQGIARDGYDVEHPFGLTPEVIDAWRRRQDAVRVHNHPVRDVKEQDVLDFLLEPNIGEEAVFTSEIVHVIEETLA